MHPLVDWYTFVLPLPSPVDGVGEGALGYIRDRLRYFKAWKDFEDITSPAYQIKEKGVYGVGGVVDAESEVAIYWGNVHAHAIIACSGRACSVILDCARLYELIGETHHLASRCDLAVDFKTDIDVVHWIVNKKKMTIKTCSHIKSEQGETRYIGSRKSERFLRIYRYYHPHPRSHLLRCELECKGKKAKAVAARFLKESPYEIILSELAPYLDENPLWLPDQALPPPSKALRQERTSVGRLRWLDLTVVPALRKAHEDGIIDLPSWLVAHQLTR